MEVDNALNLIMPVMRPSGIHCYVISPPLHRLVLKAYSMPIAKAWSTMYEQGIHVIAGPPIAKDALEQASKAMQRDAMSSWWEGPNGVEMGLLNEIWRVTSVLAPGENGGWDQMMYLEARDRAKIITEDEADQVENALVFFTLNWRMLHPLIRQGMIAQTGQTWGWQVSPSTISEFRASLGASTKAETSEQSQPPVSMIR